MRHDRDHRMVVLLDKPLTWIVQWLDAIRWCLGYFHRVKDLLFLIPENRVGNEALMIHDTCIH